jgi:predicted N-acetyltransferase YhbS
LAERSNLTPRLRIGRVADARGITRLINAAFEVERFFLDADRITIAEVLARFDKGTFILAEQAGALAGCVYVETGPERAYLGLLSVDPGLQRSGIGKRLVSAAEKHCLDAGSRFVDLRIVSLRTELPAYYEGLGYLQTGTLPFPEEAQPKLPCHFLVMSKPL